MKKSRKTLTLNKLVISKLTNPSSIMGGSLLGCNPKSKEKTPPICPIPPRPTKGPDCTMLDTHLDC